MHWCMWVFMRYACVTAQLYGVTSLLPPCRFQGWNSGINWQKVSLSSEPSQ